MTITHDTDTVTPAALEDVLEASPVQDALLEGLFHLESEIDELQARRDALRDELRKSMNDTNAQALTKDSKVVARISTVLSSRIDSKTLKAELPEIASKYLVVTKSIRFSTYKPKVKS